MHTEFIEALANQRLTAFHLDQATPPFFLQPISPHANQERPLQWR
jgi:hypothetical protein